MNGSNHEMTSAEMTSKAITKVAEASIMNSKGIILVWVAFVILSFTTGNRLRSQGAEIAELRATVVQMQTEAR